MNSEVSLIRGCEEDAKGGDLRIRDTTPKKGLPVFFVLLHLCPSHPLLHLASRSGGDDLYHCKKKMAIWSHQVT